MKMAGNVEKEISGKWEEIMESMNRNGADMGALLRNDHHKLLEMMSLGSKGSAAMASEAMRAEKEAEKYILKTYKDIASGKMKVPVTYEDPVGTPLKGYQAQLLRSKWDLWMDYRPHDGRLNHFSSWMLNIYMGNFEAFMEQVSSLSDAELKKKLEMRETLLCVGAVFHAVIGARSLTPGSEYLENTEQVRGRVGMNHMRILEKLVELGADVNCRDVAGFTPLHHCLTAQGNPVTFKMAKLLLKNGANVNAQNRFGCPTLSVCVMCGNLEFIELLIKHGADPHIKDNDGCSPSMCAQHYPAASKLLKAGEKGVLRAERETAKEKDMFKKCPCCKESASNRCTGCFLEWYCGAKCQKEHWTEHKAICKETRKKFLPVTFVSGVQSGFNHQTGKTFCNANGPIKAPKSTSFVVKVQVPLSGGTEQPMMVYNKERSVHGVVEQKGEAGGLLANAVRTKGYNKNKGYFYAILEKDHLLINPSILPPETW
jgi:hypothetical protein